MNAFHRTIVAVAGALALALLPGPLFAQDGQDAIQDDADMALGIPQPMTVESIDLKNGVVVLDGERYRVYPGRKDLRAPGRGPALELQDLAVGMSVLVATDGTQPGRSHQPYVLGLWLNQ